MPTCDVQEDEQCDAVQRRSDGDVVEGRVQADVLAKGGKHEAALGARQQRRQRRQQHHQPHRLPPLALGAQPPQPICGTQPCKAWGGTRTCSCWPG